MKFNSSITPNLISNRFTLLKLADKLLKRSKYKYIGEINTMPDKDINKIYKVKRIGYSVLMKVLECDPDGNYKMVVLNILDGTTMTSVGDIFNISKRELELCGKIQ